jgi:hypothetical protein
MPRRLLLLTRAVLTRAVLQAALVVAMVGASSRAGAQTLSFIQQGGIIRDHQDSDLVGDQKINRQDCLTDDYFDFALNPVGLGGVDLDVAVWMSRTADVDCGDPTNQTVATGVCRQVAENVVDRYQVRVYVRDIVSDAWGPWMGRAGADVCEDRSEQRVERVLHFFAVDASGTAGPPLNYAIEYDLAGPSPPTSVKAGVGEDALIVSWKEPAGATGVSRYRIYAEPVSAPPLPVAGAGGAGGAGNGGIGGSDMSGAGMSGAGMGGAGMGGAGAGGAGADAAGMSGAGAGSGGAGAGGAGAGGSAGAAAPGSCTSNILFPGEPVPAGITHKGEANASSVKAEASGLMNGVPYAVAVAGVDDFFNSGALSQLDCETPELVTGFYEAYRWAGGEGGGGFCAIAGARSRLSAAAIALVALGLVLRRVRRRRPTSRGAS